MSGWVVVMTKPNCENMAVANLVQQGISCYAPRFKETRPDRSVILKPLFPRYIFSLIDTMWYCIRGTRGVSHLLMGHDGPQQISHKVIDAIRSREDGEGFILLEPKRTERFKPGDKVTATEGLLAGRLMIYEGMTGKDRVQVLTSIFGRETITTIEEKLLVAA